MKYGSPISLRSQLSRQQQMKAIQRCQYQQARFWPPYFGICKVFCSSITLRKEKTINSKYYIALLVRLKEEITKKRPQMKKKKVPFHQDNALCHESIEMMAKLHELLFRLLPHPPYSSNLAPNDYWLFADLKRMLQQKKFGSNEEVILETEAYLKAKDKLFNKKRHQIVREELESMYHPWRRLLMNKVEFCLKIVVLLVNPRTNWVMCHRLEFKLPCQ